MLAQLKEFWIDYPKKVTSKAVKQFGPEVCEKMILMHREKKHLFQKFSKDKSLSHEEKRELYYWWHFDKKLEHQLKNLLEEVRVLIARCNLEKERNLEINFRKITKIAETVKRLTAIMVSREELSDYEHFMLQNILEEIKLIIKDEKNGLICFRDGIVTWTKNTSQPVPYWWFYNGAIGHATRLICGHAENISPPVPYFSHLCINYALEEEVSEDIKKGLRDIKKVIHDNMMILERLLLKVKRKYSL